MTSHFQLVNEITEEVLDLSPDERDPFLVERCGGDDALLSAVRRLLAFADSTDESLDDRPVAEIRPGDILAGRFKIVCEVAAGSTGTIFLAEDEHLGEVALKVLHPDLCANSRWFARFCAEVAIARAIRHRHVCPVFDLFVFELEGQKAVAATMKYLRGETLADRFARGPIPSDQTAHIARGIAAGIDALHAEGVLHRDLKPANIMLTGPEDAVVPVILDFGLATQVSAEGGDPFVEGISGSLDYMAPEQFRSAAITPAADIYSFGLILFEMLAGVRPFPREDLLPTAIRRTSEIAPRIMAVAPDVPHAWEQPIARALSRDASKRPESAMAILREFERLSASAVRPISMDTWCRHPVLRVSTGRRRARAS